MNRNSGTKRSSNSLDKHVRQQQHTFGSQDHQSDLEMRQSPKPTLSTNRISKSKSQQQASFGLLPRSAGLDSYPNLFSTDRNNPQISGMLSELVDNWRQLTIQQFSVLPQIEMELGHMLDRETTLKLRFLLTLKEVLVLRKKMHDVGLNVGLLEMEGESKVNVDRNKLLVLEILHKKLSKKYGIASLKFNFLKRKVQNPTKIDRQIMTNRSVKLVEGEMMSKAIERVTERILAESLNKIKKAVFLVNLLSPGSDHSEDQEVPQQRNHPSMLELTLSPNNFGYMRDEQKSNQKSQNSYKKYQSPSTYPPPLNIRQDWPPLAPKTVPSKTPNPQTERVQKDEVEYDLQAETRSIVEVHKLIKGLSKDISSLKSRFRQDREVKQKQVYFNVWKVQFLRKHEQALVGRWRYWKEVKDLFNLWKDVTFDKQSYKDVQGQPQKEEKESLKVEKKLLKNLLKKNAALTFFSKLKDRIDTKKIWNICRCVYENNLKTRAFYSWANEKSQSLQKSPSPPKQIQLPTKSLSKQIPSTYFSSYDPQFREVSGEDQIEQEQEEDFVSQIKSPANITAIIFYHNNLLTKYFINFKRHHQLCGGVRILSRFFSKYSFDRIKFFASRQAKLQQKLARFRKQKQLVSRFRCFNILKRVNEGAPPSSLVEGFILQRQRAIQATYFSALKLMWKKYLIKKKIAQRLNNNHLQRRIFSQFTTSIKLSQKSRALRHSLHQRNSVMFMRNLLKNYLEQRQLQRKVSSLRCVLFENKVDFIKEALGNWRRLTTKKRNFGIIVERMRRLKEKEVKARVFGEWWGRVFGEEGEGERREQSESMQEQQSQMEASQEHKYWLEKYFQSLSALGR